MNMRVMGKLFKTAVKQLFNRGIFKSYAQNGEDVLIWQAVRGKKNGMYVEVGAFHPVQYSNTYALYKRGWKGLVIDANDESRPLFRVMRPRDTFVHTAIAEQRSTQTYYRFADPAYNTLSPEYAERWQKKGVRLMSASSVTSRPLWQILHDYGIDTIDVLAIDAEGFDMAVLDSHDWNVATEVIVIESHDFNIVHPERDQAYQFLTSKGYSLQAFAGFSLVFKKV